MGTIIGLIAALLWISSELNSERKRKKGIHPEQLRDEAIRQEIYASLKGKNK